MPRLVAALTTAVLAAFGAGATTGAARVEARAQTLLVVQSGVARTRPATFGGNHWGFTKLRWSHWSSSSATATGDAVWSFPGGDGVHHARVTLHFSKLRQLCGHRTYTAVTFRTRGGATGEGALTSPVCFWSGF